MELRQLQYFVKVARMQHVTHAAEELHIAQSAVSRQIHLLEEELGVTLFKQQGRNLQLSPVGELFLNRAERILADIERAVVEVRDFQDPELGEIRLGFPHSVGVNVIPSVVSNFRRQHPKVKFKFRQGTYNSLIREVIKGDLDLALVSPFPHNHEQLAGEVLLTEELFAILPPTHRLSKESAIRLNQLKDDSFVLFGEGYSLRHIVVDACKEAGFTPLLGFEGEETDTIRGLVAAGMGVSLLPEMALQEISPLQPAKVKIVEPQVTRTVGLIRRIDARLPLVAEMFRDYLSSEHFHYKKAEFPNK